MSMPEETILEYAGFDAAIFLRFYSVAFKVRENDAQYAKLTSCGT